MNVSEIRRIDGRLIFSHPSPGASLKAVVELAVAYDLDLSHANLQGANLSALICTAQNSTTPTYQDPI